MTDQWKSIAMGGNGASVWLLAHLACGAYVFDADQHQKVCTAPRLEAPPSRIGETHDWEN